MNIERHCGFSVQLRIAFNKREQQLFRDFVVLLIICWRTKGSNGNEGVLNAVESISREYVLDGIIGAASKSMFLNSVAFIFAT